MTSEGRRIDSDLLDKANDIWERVKEKAENEYEDRRSAAPVSFGDYVPTEFHKRLASSSAFSKDLVKPLIDYFIKLELTETSCASINDLNLVGKIEAAAFLLPPFAFRIRGVRRPAR